MMLSELQSVKMEHMHVWVGAHCSLYGRDINVNLVQGIADNIFIYLEGGQPTHYVCGGGVGRVYVSVFNLV